ncbi:MULTISPECIES: GAF domain-containing serine/threonine-protein kinase [unclassified Arthrobacter]|uniref:GAF domain-containing serine/threonine-protein kinase n=1 Tax=unclassified Arthrobacter TaxID=235627 RepID=UPI002E0B81A0|nr:MULTISPECIES: GAF domain-containing serine/threonine-protein kinase [unclassified Arthrobacter]MEC5191214.1 tRNA A-37 threonylcarbamoyl transferase component Bud32 [Arthrobacter sp. MP_M4]MEC5202547.1 tRNA A-37 threonylcarbamoyl transferase component Bud32 [Arthrobacter sp. MP_M7]
MTDYNKKTGMEPGFLLSGRYRIQALIGRGSQSTVYRAYDELLQREIAVKLFRDDPDNLEHTRQQGQEVRILAGMSHHALVTLFDAGADLSDPGARLTYLVMELVRGPDLRHRAAQGPISAAHMAVIGYDLADGLSYIHHHGIVHRDVKPANILLVDYSNADRRPRAKLTDFGVAIITGRDPVEDDGGTSGTPAYLSPEQAAGDPAGPLSDVYSLGLVLLEGLTGKMAYPGAPIQSAVARLLHDPDIPEELAPMWTSLLSSMLARNPADRPPAREVSLALRQEVINGAARHRLGKASGTGEEARMRAVERYRILDTPADGAFDRIAALASRVFSVPVAIVSVVDHDRIWFKAHHGTEVTQISRDPGLCASAILQDEAWIVKDATTDPRTLANPLVAGEFGLQFYAGVPLRTPDGYNLGTFCILDREPREFSAADTRTLEDLAAIVMNDLEMRLQSRQSVAS